MNLIPLNLLSLIVMAVFSLGVVAADSSNIIRLQAPVLAAPGVAPVTPETPTPDPEYGSFQTSISLKTTSYCCYTHRIWSTSTITSPDGASITIDGSNTSIPIRSSLANDPWIQEFNQAEFLGDEGERIATYSLVKTSQNNAKWLFAIDAPVSYLFTNALKVRTMILRK